MANKTPRPAGVTGGPDRRLLLLTASAFALAGCGNIIGPPDAPQTMYLLTPPVASGAAGAAPVGWALAVGLPDTLDSLDTRRIALTKADDTMDYYADAIWPDRLTVLVQTALLSAFQASGRIPSVAREQDALHADYNLSTEIRDFTAHYSQPDAIPTATVVLIGRMATARGRRIVGNFTAAQSVPATANSVPAAVQAFNSALGAAVSQIVAWALSLPPPS